VSKSILEEGMQVIAKIRYSDKGSEAEIVKSTENEIQLKFILPKSAITPGQSLVIYDNSGYVLAGGIIDRINS